MNRWLLYESTQEVLDLFCQFPFACKVLIWQAGAIFAAVWSIKVLVHFVYGFNHLPSLQLNQSDNICFALLDCSLSLTWLTRCLNVRKPKTEKKLSFLAFYIQVFLKRSSGGFVRLSKTIGMFSSKVFPYEK